MTAEHRNKFLLIDDAFLLEVHDLERKVNPAIKHPEPVFRLDAPWDRGDDCLDLFSVIYDEKEKVFRMWYGVVSISDDLFFWHGPRTIAYATSTDGIHWEKPELGLCAYRGSTRNNYVTPQMGSILGTVIRDPSDPPSRRYKMVFTIGSDWARGGETEWAGFHVPLCIAHSADGLRWQVPTHVNPVMRGLSDAGFTFYYDEDRRKYIVLGRRVPNLPRDLSQYESFDLVNWEDRGRVLVPGDRLDAPEMYNFQNMAPFRYEDFILGMLNTQYSHEVSEAYELRHPRPEAFPGNRFGQVDIQLAYTRDGFTWERPDDRTSVVPNGPDGAPDGGHLFPGFCPLVIDGETYIFYLALTDRHNHGDELRRALRETGDIRQRSCYMLARMPEDHWVSIDAGEKEGWLLTKPYGPPSRLLVNADAQGGRIEAEICTPYNHVVPGFSRADCSGIEANGKDQEIRWRCERDPRQLLETYRGGLCLRIYLRNAKLYSYSLMEPDPDGAIRRYWEDSRWNETILHRSGNWDGDTNAPAGGVPQPPGTQFVSGTRFGPNPRAKAKWLPG
ncbi:MAG: hypothetical protein CMJ18_10650 [Phycisphaeraceae bacterium]|nr:hypothetical protein [Phycisphaeraceae bacterium]